jgi:NitT/TauT family transport system substrate-binding protein
MAGRRFRVPLAGAVLAGCLVMAGCSTGGGSGLSAPGNLEKTNLTVAAVPALDSAGVYIAQMRGYFADVGLHVTIVPAVSGADVIAQQESGKVDASSGNYVSYILADANAKHPANLRIIAPGSVMQPNNQMIMVPADSKIQTVSQLQNQTVAVNAPDNIGTLLVESVLSDSAIANPTTAVTFKTMPFQDMATALARHQVAAAWMPEPFVSQAEQQVGAVPLADADQGLSQNLPIAGYVVTAAWLKKYPHTAAAFQAAIEKAQAVAATDPAAVEQGMAKFAGAPAGTAAIAAQPEFPTASNPLLIQRLADLMLTPSALLQQQFQTSVMFQGVPKS